MGSCSDCGAKTGVLQKVCTSCMRRKQLEDYNSFIDAFKSRRPDLLEAWETSVKDSRKWEQVQNYLTMIINDEPPKDLLAAYPPDFPSVLLLDQIPSGDKVLAYATGINKGEKADHCIWILTNRNILIARFGFMRRSELRGSELVPIEQITGFEKKQTDRKNNFWEMIISRASNVDGLTTVDEAVATRMLSSYTSNRAKSGSETVPLASSKDPSESLRKLKALLDDGLITQAEFDEKRKRLIDEM